MTGSSTHLFSHRDLSTGVKGILLPLSFNHLGSYNSWMGLVDHWDIQNFVCLDILWCWRCHKVQSNPLSYLQGSNVITGGVFQLDDKKNLPWGCTWVLEQLLQLFVYYWLYSVIHTVGVPGHIHLAVGVKPYCSLQTSQGYIFYVLLFLTVLCKFLTEEKHLAKNSTDKK